MPCVFKTSFAKNQFEIGSFLERPLPVAAKSLDDAALAFEHATHAYRDRSGADAVVFRAPGEISDASAGHHGLGGRAADVDASAADVLALDHRNLPAGASERNP